MVAVALFEAFEPAQGLQLPLALPRSVFAAAALCHCSSVLIYARHPQCPRLPCLHANSEELPGPPDFLAR